jgi:hypothetical protein
MCNSSTPNSHQPPRPITQPREPKSVEKRETMKFLTQIITNNFLFLFAFGFIIDSILLMLVLHLAHLPFLISTILNSSVVLLENKVEIFVLMILTCCASLMILFLFSGTYYAFTVALFAWIFAFMVVFFPDRMRSVVKSFLTNLLPSVGVMVLVTSLAIFIGFFWM